MQQKTWIHGRRKGQDFYASRVQPEISLYHRRTHRRNRYHTESPPSLHYAARMYDVLHWTICIFSRTLSDLPVIRWVSKHILGELSSALLFSKQRIRRVRITRYRAHSFSTHSYYIRRETMSPRSNLLFAPSLQNDIEAERSHKLEVIQRTSDVLLLCFGVNPSFGLTADCDSLSS